MRTTSTGVRTAALNNSRKITALLEHGTFEGSDTVDIYRTWTVGTASGRLHSDVLIGWLRFLPDGPDDFAVIDRRGYTVGRIRRDHKEVGRTEMPGWRGRVTTTIHVESCWSAHDYLDAEFTPRGFLGYFDTVSAAMQAVLR
jgi:hypothetical protein